MVVINILLYIAALGAYIAGAPIWVPFVLLLLAICFTAVLCGLDLSDLLDVFS